MRIAIVASNMGRGGAETQLMRLARGLRQRGHDAHVWNLAPVQEWHDEIDAWSIPTEEHARGLRRGHPRAVASMVASWRRFAPEVVCAFGPTAILAIRASRTLCPTAGLVYSFRNATEPGTARAKLLRATAWQAAPTVFNSRHVARAAVHDGLVDRAHAIVIRNGIDTTPFDRDVALREQTRAELGIGPQQTLLLAVGHLTRQKNYPALVRAFDEIADKYPGLQLRIAGQFHGAEQEMQSLARPRWTDGQIVALGGRRDVPALLQAADAFVLPSLFEGSPNALAEAMAARLPVAATPVDGVTELIVSPAQGWVARDTSTEAIAEVLSGLLDAPAAERARRGAAARAVVDDLHGIERMVDEFEQVFDRVAIGLHAEEARA